jgi:hypothetical protein
LLLINGTEFYLKYKMFTFLEFRLRGLGAFFLLPLHSFRKLYDTINDRFW